MLGLVAGDAEGTELIHKLNLPPLNVENDFVEQHCYLNTSNEGIEFLGVSTFHTRGERAGKLTDFGNLQL